MHWPIVLAILMLWPYGTFGVPTNESEDIDTAKLEQAKHEIETTSIREGREIGLWQMSTARLARSTTPATPHKVPRQIPDVPMPKHFPKASFLVPFGRKLTKESTNLQRKASTVDVVKTSNVRKRNFNPSPSSVLSDRTIRLSEVNNLQNDNKNLHNKPVAAERELSQNKKTVWRDNSKEKLRSSVVRLMTTASPKSSLTATRSPVVLRDAGGSKNIRKDQSGGSTKEFFGRRETGVRRALPKLGIDHVRGREKVTRGRVRIKGALLRQIQARREKEEQKIPRKNEQLISARPSRLRIRNMNLRRNVTTTIKNFSPTVETSSPKTNGYSVNTNEIKIGNSSQNEDIVSVTTMRSSPATTAKQVAEKINRKIGNDDTSTTERSDLEITSLKVLVKQYQDIQRPSAPTTNVLLQQFKRSSTTTNVLLQQFKRSSTTQSPVKIFKASTTPTTTTKSPITNTTTDKSSIRKTRTTKSPITNTTTDKSSIRKTTTAKSQIAQTTTAKSPITKTTASKSSFTKTTTAKSPIANTTTAKSPITKTTATKSPITKTTTAKSPITKTTTHKTTTETVTTSTTTVTTLTTSTKLVSSTSEAILIPTSTYPTLNLNLRSSTKFGKNQSVSKVSSLLDEHEKPSHLSFFNQNHPVSKSEPVRPRVELKKDLLDAIRRKISKNKLMQAQRESKIDILNQTKGTKPANLQLRISNFPSSNLVSTKPPFFRPISFPFRRDNISEGRNYSQPKVKIFVNLPNTKPGSIVKIPNVSKIQDKLQRLNAAITQGLKIQRRKQEQEARDKEIAEQTRKLNSHKLEKMSHPTLATSAPSTTSKTIKRFTRTNPPETTTPISIPFKTQVTTEKLIQKIITVNYFEKLRKEQENLAAEINLNRISSTTTQSTIPTSVSTTKSKPKKPRKYHPSYVEHRSSHFRPKNNSELYPMPKSTMGKSPIFIVTPKYGTYRPRRRNITENKVTGSEPDTKVIEDITGTTVYVVGVIAIIPAAGILAWLVRFVMKRKELSSLENNSETGLNRPITEADSLQVSGRHSQVLAGACFETIQEGPENIPKVDNLEVGACGTSMWEFPRSRLRLQAVLGEGNFGKVWKAEADDICGYDGTILVAVKTVKENSAQREVEDLIQEMKIMQEIGPHANVVTILGVCSEQEPYLLIMEYVMYGKLLTHLREQRSRQSSFFNFSKDGAEIGETFTSKDLTKFAYGVAKGMEFLGTKGVIHRDLAARNILVDHNKNTKISDFGLSRNLRDLGGEMYEQKTKGALPIRWMAPESLYFSVFTAKSDVWGFGILMWEIVTLGSTPYPGMGVREVMRRVRDGYRLERPAHCHPELYLIIQKCWVGDMNKRPDFSEIRKELAKLLEDQHGYIDLQNIPENKYYSMDQNPDEEEKL